MEKKQTNSKPIIRGFVIMILIIVIFKMEMF